ncbi:MAG: glycogen debranching enzyme family protein [Phycisphaerae bacterium]|nr:glycogen debranching enzyme family protein [Phycisphaerae bacterium]
MPTDAYSLAPLRPTVVYCPQFHRDQLLSMEWLRTNRLGAYSSSTVVGCNTRRYHGLLVAATHPPVGRVVALTTVMEQLVIRGRTYDLATNEFIDTFSPSGYSSITEFHDGPDACFVHAVGGTTLRKRVVLSDEANAVAVHYELEGPAEELILRPFAALRDFHALRSAAAGHEMLFAARDENGVEVHDRLSGYPGLFLRAGGATFQADPQWWYRLLYRADLARGQEAFEDLYSPGVFVWRPGDAGACTLSASLGEPADVKYRAVLGRRRRRQAELLTPFAHATPSTRRLAVASDAYIVDRRTRRGDGASILAGFPWFADWGRDTFIALPGLLLCTRQFDLARRVFETYAEAVDEGMIPNRFDDYSEQAHFNSVDASLWFILAAERYLRATNDEAFGRDVLLPACREILTRYTAGTRFGIRADADGLLQAGSRDTQLTWMDAKIGLEAVTPRWGKAVEVNALWYCAHRILAERLAEAHPKDAQNFTAKAELIAKSFVEVFWNRHFEWLHDVVNEDGPDASLRPNQIFAASLPYSPLSLGQQGCVLRAVRENLFTPMGLRTLSPRDRRYRDRYGGCGESRERAYHQGTVWAWLMGPFIEAHLKVENAAQTPKAVAQAEAWMFELDAHLDAAGLGHVSEIFDGSPPHEPHGCFAQAWSVAEALRAKCLIEECKAQCASRE